MGIYEKVQEFAGKRVYDYDPSKGLQDPSSSIPRIGVDWDQSEKGVTVSALLDNILSDPQVDKLTGIVIGCWEHAFESEGFPKEFLEKLFSACAKLPLLTSLFIGDITQEECEISWIQQGNYSAIWSALPELRHLRLRGGNGLSLGNIKHNNLISLVIETGGLPSEVTREVCKAELPQLEHLELWLGDGNYGGDTSIEDLKPLLAGELFPRLQYLGLRNSEIADEVAEAVSNAPVLERVDVLDLSLGNMSRKGAAALVASSYVPGLKLLDIHHHFIPESAVTELNNLGVVVDASKRQSEEEYNGEIYRYIAVSE